MRRITYIECPYCGRAFKARVKFKNKCPFCKRIFYAWRIKKVGVPAGFSSIRWLRVEKRVILVDFYSEDQKIRVRRVLR